MAFGSGNKHLRAGWTMIAALLIGVAIVYVGFKLSGL